MARWTEDEIAALRRFGPHGWAEFSAAYPDRSYDSWECKRRRLYGGSAGTRKVITATSLRSALDAHVDRLLALTKAQWEAVVREVIEGLS